LASDRASFFDPSDRQPSSSLKRYRVEFVANAVLVRLVRAIADAGCASFRFDYHGVGESTGSPPHFRRGEPFLEGPRWRVALAPGSRVSQFRSRRLVFRSRDQSACRFLRKGHPGVALVSYAVAVDEHPLEPDPRIVATMQGASERGVACSSAVAGGTKHLARSWRHARLGSVRFSTRTT
jgi:hypothetical protein